MVQRYKTLLNYPNNNYRKYDNHVLDNTFPPAIFQTFGTKKKRNPWGVALLIISGDVYSYVILPDLHKQSTCSRHRQYAVCRAVLSRSPH
jgi:hypothetical protein